MVYRSPAGAFVFHLKTALLGGIFGIPVIMHQAWLRQDCIGTNACIRCPLLSSPQFALLAGEPSRTNS